MTLGCERRGAVLVLTWDRQSRRNALDPPTLHALADAIAGARSDPQLRACVLRGAGTVAFSAGMDLTALAEAEGRRAAGVAVARWNEVMDDAGRVLVVAAVNGMAMGGGFEIVLRCDLVVAAEHAEFGLPEVTRGLVPRGGALLLPTRVALPFALEAALLGERIPATRLHALGLVNRVVPVDEVTDVAVALAERVASHAPDAVRTIRQEMWAAAGAPPAARILPTGLHS